MEICRLPYGHPDFFYAPSKNPYAAKLATLEGRAFANGDTETRRGKWREAFADAPARTTHRRELHVELGCNAGHVLLEWAARNPRAAYVGLECKFKQAYRGAEKALKRGLPNAMFLRARAERLPFIFGEGEIDRLYLFFPDPWPKKAQMKNRFVTAENLERLAPAVAPGGLFEIRTDHPGYFEWMEEAVSRAPSWEVVSRTGDRHAGCADPGALQIPDVTLFERIFIREGIKINQLVLKRRELTS